MSTAAPGRAPGRRRLAGFAVFIVALTVLFLALSIWQFVRLGEKEVAVAAVASRRDLPPMAFPGQALWDDLDASSLDYRPVTVTGTLRADNTVRVFASLGQEARGQHSGPGYWLMTPLQLAGGGSVFINRGFVPEAVADDWSTGLAEVGVTVTGLARLPEPGNSFTPAADQADRIDWIRSIDRLASLVDPALAPFAPVYVDAPAGAAGALPQGGETLLEIANRHLEYALTWLALALLTPLLFGLWLRHQSRGGRDG